MRDIKPTGPRKKQPPLPGKNVPIASIHVDTPPQKRPLFYSRKVKTKARKVRIGHKERYLLLGVLGLVVLAVFLAGVIFLPTAKIKLITRTAPLLIEQPLKIQANNTSGEANVVPGSVFFRELQVEGESPVASTEVIGTKAQGTVAIVNRTLDEQKILGQSRLITKDGTLFFTNAAVTVPPDSRVNVGIEADKAGEASNIEPQRLDFAALPEGSRKVVFAELQQKLTGGTGETVPVIKEEDIKQASDAAAREAREKVTEEIRQELPKDWVILEESWTTEPQSFESDAKVGERKPVIRYKGRMIIRVLGYERATLDKNLEAALSQKLSADFMLFPGPISYTLTIQNVQWEASQAQVQARVTHTTLPRISLDTLRDKLAGRSKEDARAYLEGLSGVRSAQVDLWPFWVNSIPRIHKRISIDLAPEQQPL